MKAFSEFAGLLLFGALSIHVAYGADGRSFVNHKFGYQLSVPKGWNIEVPPSNVPVLFNNKPSEGLPQGLIADGGAEIYLIPYGAVKAVTPAKEMQEWIAANSARWHTNVRHRTIASWTTDPFAPQRITRVDADYERAEGDEKLQSEVIIISFCAALPIGFECFTGKANPTLPTSIRS